MTQSSEMTSVPPASSIHESLQSIAVATSQIADYVRMNPSELASGLESAKGIAGQFTELIDHASEYSESMRELQSATQEAIKASDWIGGRFSGGGVSVNNSFGRVVGSFHEL